MLRNLMPVELAQKYVKRFMNIIILAMLKQKPMHGYDLIAAIHEKFRVLVGPGALYPVLHSLEKDKLIVGHTSGKRRKTVYTLTVEGAITLNKLLNDLVRIQNIYSRVLQDITVEK